MDPPFFISTLDGDEWSASCPSRFTCRESAPVAYYIGGSVDPRAGLDNVEKRKTSLSTAGNRTRVIQFVAPHSTDKVIQVSHQVYYKRNLKFLSSYSFYAGNATNICSFVRTAASQNQASLMSLLHFHAKSFRIVALHF
jgi:hypothetical protein